MSSPHLRPLGIGDLLDTAFRLYRSHFVMFCQITALLLVPITIIGLFTIQVPLVDSLLGMVQSFVVANILAAALVYCAWQFYLHQSPTVQTAYQVGWKACYRVFGATFLQGLALLVPIGAIACIVVFAVSAGNAASWLGLGAAILVLPLIVLLTTRWYVAIPVILIEQLGPVDSLRRSWNLTKGRVWPVFFTALALGVLTAVLTSVPTLFVTYGSSILFGLNGGDLPLGQEVAYVLTQIGLILTMPLSSIVQTLVYYDLRVRGEAYDLEMIAANPAPV